MSTLRNKYQEALKANSTENYTTVSVRTPMEVATMIDTISLVTQEAVMNLFTDDLSEQLADYLLQESRNQEVIEKILQQQYLKHGSLAIEDSCIEALERRDAIDVDISTPNPFSHLLNEE